ncbi:MAG TPA: NADP-dependent isocitrate dehydrogenase [Hydrogenophaga sp.]|mgnify:CR=1 FL=1|uniref:NADP-dependent isocitrate dehydrogenase n=1 Tax=Hydrogenophaga sp. TaxID=1904254 RepID=UPI002B7A91B5|nr:NADP-dependent isocitrate dehydrogenase [Hydrogenophaga sp.]HMN92111.1 NADP-dependent isocitrate dehydrogenase [Hydrogenophaga sp.]HMP10521.1 NADP-dependent isocitrate dehydrogenase [Hydrogenophaga sp.]
MKNDAPQHLLSTAEPGSGRLAVPITVAHGDGIGPEIMEATLKVLQAAGASIAPEVIEVGEKVYLGGHSSGIAPDAWDSLRRTRVLLKGPITTPSGRGYKSLNVTIRKTLGLFANVRPCISYSPFVPTRHPALDIVVVRENEEDLYAGIEHRQTGEVVQCLKLISRPGCERIVRYAFEYARAHGRRKLTCMTKDNIMKMTDGLFHEVFDEVAREYPELVAEHMIIDIGAARVATRPEQFDVIVTSNLYGDILSDIVAEMTGSVGLAGSANIGRHAAMFEAIHGSAPDIAGRGVANPSGLLLAAVMMLVHIGQPDVAARIHNAWLSTLEDGVFTADLAGRGQAGRVGRPFGSMDFADAVIERLGRRPHTLPAVDYPEASADTAPDPVEPEDRSGVPVTKRLLGVDVFLHEPERSPDDLARRLLAVQSGTLQLQMITNRGVKVWPQGLAETSCTDHWRCRYLPGQADSPIRQRQVIELLGALTDAGLDVIKTENLYDFDGVKGFSLGQGQ